MADEEQSSGPLTRVSALGGGFVSLIATTLLLILAVAVFGQSVYTLLHNLRSSEQFTVAIDQALNDALLLLIIGELLVTVTQKANLVRELLDFLVIGVTTLVRHALQLVLTPPNPQSTQGTQASHNVTPDLLINAGGIVLLIVAFLAVRWVEALLYPPAAKPPTRDEIVE